MAPPLPLAHVAGSLALGFTTGRAAPPSEPQPEPEPSSVPAPPSLPPLPGETTTASEPTTAPAVPDGGVTTEPATPEPELLGPVAPFEDPGLEEADEDDADEDTRAEVAAHLLRPNTKKLMFSLFVGGSRALRGGYTPFGTSDFKAELAIGGHDRRFRVGGFAVLQVTSGFPFNTLTLAPRLSINRQLVPDYAFYFTTNVLLGYRATSYGAYGFITGLFGAYHSGVLGVSCGVSAIVAERLLLSFRPLELELVAPATGPLVQINWSAMGGLGVLWGESRNRRRGGE
jgi:hypothetical protein